MNDRRPVRRVSILLIGLGNVGRRFVELMERKRGTLRRRGLELILTGAADSSGAAMAEGGLDLSVVIRLKREGRGMADYPQRRRAFPSPLALVQQARADVLLDASPVNLRHGQPGLGCVEAALGRGMHVVLANKAPLVLAYDRLAALAEENGALLRFCATVAGGLPAVNLGRRDLAGAEVLRLEGLLNLTANYILHRMAEGRSYAQALAEAQAAGHAETDPRLDVDGWDAANKLIILAHSVLDYPATLAEVEVEGIAAITADDLRRAQAEGRVIRLLSIAERSDDGYRLSARPTALEASHPLAQLGPEQMGIVYHTDIYGTISAAITERDPLPTAAAMLRDVIDICESRG